jgi:hypothetical protein
MCQISINACKAGLFRRPLSSEIGERILCSDVNSNCAADERFRAGQFAQEKPGEIRRAC